MCNKKVCHVHANDFNVAALKAMCMLAGVLAGVWSIESLAAARPCMVMPRCSVLHSTTRDAVQLGCSVYECVQTCGFSTCIIAATELQCIMLMCLLCSVRLVS